MRQSNQHGKKKQPVDQQFVDQIIHEEKIWSRFSLVVAILGVSILLLGVGSSFLGLTSIGIVGVAGGTVTSAVSVLVHRPANDNLQRKKEIFDILQKHARFNFGLSLVEELPVEVKERVLEKYIAELSYQPSKDRVVPELPMQRQSGKNTSQLPPNPENDTNT
jgi:hypothetical protein